jgi:hypothetical protein
MRYDRFVCRGLTPPVSNLERLPMIKLIVRAFAICVVLSGAAAVSLSSASTHAMTSHQSATSAMPVPLCGPWAPCPPAPGPSGNIR